MSAGRHGFRRRGPLQQWSLHFGPNMTPMVDVVMVILVFFMASAAFLGPEWFLRSLVPKPPTPGAGETQPPPKPADPLALPPVRQEITLEVDALGKTIANGLGETGLEIAQMIAAVERFAEGTAKDKIEVLIRPAPSVPYRDVVKLHEGCEKTGIGRVGVAVNAPPPK
jgi:biopolymer transport protein ExbD